MFVFISKLSFPDAGFKFRPFLLYHFLFVFSLFFSFFFKLLLQYHITILGLFFIYRFLITEMEVMVEKKKKKKKGGTLYNLLREIKAHRFSYKILENLHKERSRVYTLF